MKNTLATRRNNPYKSTEIHRQNATITRTIQLSLGDVSGHFHARLLVTRHIQNPVRSLFMH